MNGALNAITTKERKKLLALEAKRRKNGEWGEWEAQRFPAGSVGGGWCAQITKSYKNRVFAVLERTVGDVTHFAVISLSGRRPSWHEMQRIKDGLAGPGATAVEVYPPKSEIVDDADVFHIWVLPVPLPFSIHDNRSDLL